MHSRRSSAVFATAWMLFCLSAIAAAADWRPSLTRTFASIDESRSTTLAALKPLWERAPSLGAEWALYQSQPILLELEAHEGLTPERFDALAPEEQARLIEETASKTTAEARGHADETLGELEADFAKQGPADWKKRLLTLERWRLYLAPEQLERLTRATRRVNAALWESRAAAIRSAAPGEDSKTYLAELSALSLLRSRLSEPGETDRRLAAELQPYSPALDPGRFFLLEDDSPLSTAILFGDVAIAGAVHRLSVHPKTPREAFAFLKPPAEAPLRTLAALHEGFHQGDPGGSSAQLYERLKTLLRADTAEALTGLLTEGFTELRARRALAFMAADGKLQTPPSREWFDSLGYTPYVRVAAALEKALGGIWAVEDLVLRADVAGLRRLAGTSLSALDAMGEQLLYFLRGGNDDFRLKENLLAAVSAVLQGEFVHPDDVRRLTQLISGYHAEAGRLRDSLPPWRRAAFTQAVRAPGISPDQAWTDLRLGLAMAARRVSWMPRWLWRPIELLLP